MAARKPRDNTPRGASTSTVSWRAVFDAWREHHRESARDSLQRMLRAPFQHVLTALVIGITLALPTLLTLGIDNLHQLGKQWDGAPRLSAYLQRDITPEQLQATQQQLQQAAGVLQVTLVTPAQGLQELEATTGLAGTLALLDENPLPPVLVAEFSRDTPASQLEAQQQAWQQLPQVESVDADLAWVRKLFHLMALGKRATIFLSALLGLGALLSVGNTIRLAIENRRAEIQVAKLVGATDAFVRRPFLYSGFWYGLSGGIVAIALVFAGFASLERPVQELAALYHASFTLHTLDAATAVGLLFVGMSLGILGAWLAVGQHLHEMRPR